MTREIVGAKVDLTGWNRKYKGALNYLARELPVMVRKDAQDVNRRIIKNLSGPQINPKVRAHPAIGRMPIPRRTSALVHSIFMKKANDLLFFVGSDQKIAPHNRAVHRRRRYIGDVIQERAAAMVNHWRYAIKRAMNRL